jgi:hypothetical protein
LPCRFSHGLLRAAECKQRNDNDNDQAVEKDAVKTRRHALLSFLPT